MNDLLNEVFPDTPAITIEGAKVIGKTEAVRCRVQCILEFDNPRTLSALRTDMDALLGIDEAVLIDEWQHYPPMWDHVRRAVGHRRSLAVLLTGSATPRSGTTNHSGAGRITSLAMWLMSFTKRGVASGGTDVARLLEREATVEGHSSLRLPDYAEEICTSELSGLRGIRSAALDLQLDGYLTCIIDHDLPEEGMLIRRPQALMAWLTAHTATTLTLVSYTAILEAVTAGETGKPSHAATRTYRDLLARIWVPDPVPGWITSLALLARPKTKPKHQPPNPALAARFLDITSAKLLSGAPGSGEIPGQLFEALVISCTRAHVTATGLRTPHLRTRNGDHEIDLIVKNTAGRMVAIEAKLTYDPDDVDIRHLHWLDDYIGECLVDKVVVATGEYAYRRDDRVAVILPGLLL